MPVRLCVYLGSNFGASPAYAAVARELGAALAAKDVVLVYGGGNVGLMGALADSVLGAGGEVIGVIPQHLVDSEVSHCGVTSLEVTSSMHDRKARMADLADGFIVLPGGFGTLEEVAEILTWTQLGLIAKPVVFLDVEGFWTPLLTALDAMVGGGFVRADHRRLAQRATSAAEAIALALTPMPTIVSRYQAGANTAVLVRRFNNLPTGAASGGFGKNQTSTHLHNFHSAPDSDGGPCDPGLGAAAENPLTQGRFYFPGQYYDYYYNMKRAGFTNMGTPDGDVRETLGTLWYHDHREGHTAENVYKGLAGFHILFNEYDTGDETTGFRLPSFPQFDIPMIFTDLAIDPTTGQAAFDIFDTTGHLGDKYLVNGKVQPFFDVSKRRYRLRLLDIGPSRFYQLFLTNPDNLAQSIPYWRITNDGNLMPKPLQVTSVKLAVGERSDIIVDFNKLTAAGGAAQGATRLWLENRLVQTKGDGPESSLNSPGNPANVLVEFRIGAVAADTSRDPAAIVDFAPIALPPLETEIVTRTFDFDKSNGQWNVNGQPLSCDVVRFTMKRNSTERWIFKTGWGWSHPIHNHFVEGRIVKRNGVAITAASQEYSRKDVVWLGERDQVEYVVKASDYRGVYSMHCHNAVHEDHAMMLLFAVQDVGDTKSTP